MDSQNNTNINTLEDGTSQNEENKFVETSPKGRFSRVRPTPWVNFNLRSSKNPLVLGRTKQCTEALIWTPVAKLLGMSYN